MNNYQEDNFPLVSVILPFYNRIDLVQCAISSVEKQSYKNWELIVINDGSKDKDTVLIEQKLLKMVNAIYINNLKNAGPSVARNQGIKKARGIYIAFLDSDDEWFESKLEIQLNCMLRNKWLISHTSYLRKDAVTNSQVVVHTGKINYRYPWIGYSCRIATPTVMVHRDAMIGHLFNEQLRVAEDQIVWSKLARENVIYGIDHVLAIVNTDEFTTAKNFKLQKIAQKNVRHELFYESSILFQAHFVYSFLRLIFMRLHGFFRV